MKEFPCRDCIVKPCCSEYCHKLETNERIIDIYVKSMRTCPDCGYLLNCGSNINKVTILCFNCNKAFSLSTFLKRQLKATWKMMQASPPGIIISSNPNLTLPYEKPKAAANVTMEETHVVRYTRMSKKEADYCISHYNTTFNDEVNKKITPQEWKKLARKLII